MSERITSFWPDEIRPELLSPRAILKAQAEALANQTGGVLLAEIKSTQTDSGIVELNFDIVVPALNGYRHRILTVAHDKDLPYPAMIDAETFRPGSLRHLQFFLERGELSSGLSQSRADSDTEFIDLVKMVLRSTSVLSAAQSLIVRASEALSEDDHQSQPVSS